MPRFEIETHEKEKPIILVSGDKNPLMPFLIDDLRDQFTIALLSEDEQLPQGKNIYRIRPDSAFLVKNLEEKIDYAIIFLDEKTNRKHLPSIFEKLAGDQAKATIIIPVRDVESFFDVMLEGKQLPSFYFLLLGDLYSENKGLFPESEISQIIQEAINRKSVSFTGNDLKPIFPIYYLDALLGIKQVLFGPPKKQKLYYLFYNHPETLISAAHILKRAEHDLEIQYSESKDQAPQKIEKSHEEIERMIQAKTLIVPSYLDKYFIGFEKVLHLFQEGSYGKGGSKETIGIPKEIVPQKRDLRFLGKSIFVSLLLFIALNVFFAVFAVIHLKKSVNAFMRNDYKTVMGNIRKVQLSLGVVEPSLQIISRGTTWLGIKTIDANLTSFKNSIEVLSLASENLEEVEKIPSGIDRATLEKLISSSTYLYFKATKTRDELQNKTPSAMLSPDLTQLISLLEVSPFLLGFDNEKNYLLLLQNNGELRPTGGFIGSIGELKLGGGKVEEFKINDVYEYDGKLKAHVEPHYVIRRYLQPHLYLRDSNFDPDFQKSASIAALLYHLETDKKADGVIAINFEVVRRIIDAIGTVKLAAYNKTLDKNNIFDFLQETISDNNFAGSTAKKDVLQALFNQLILKIEQDKNNFIKVARIIPSLMREKHILFAFNGTSIQKAFSSNGYGGEVLDIRLPQENQIRDYLLVNEANIGVNKANIYVSRQTEYELSLTEGGIKSKVKHIIRNEGEKSQDYKVYIRIATPRGSNLASIKIDGKEQKIVQAITDSRLYENRVFRAPPGLEVDKTIEKDRQVFGFIVTIPAKTRQVIEVNYDNGANPVSDSLVSYSLLVIKQPGTLEYPFTLKLVYDERFAAKEAELATLEENAIKIKKNILSDEIFEAQLIRR